jgi:hypothetical protein
MTNLLAQIDFTKIKVPTTGTAPIDLNSPTLTLGEIIGSIFKTYIFYAAGIALLVYMIIGGFQLMFSRGDAKAMQGAQAKITNAAIGFALIIVAFFVVQLIGQLLGVDTVFNQIFPGNIPHSFNLR